MGTSPVSTDAEKIEELLTRSVAALYPSKDALAAVLRSGKRLSVFVGIDPTADYVHLGHSTNYLILERLHKLGHQITVLVGDFTAMIGDPSDKSSARVQLSREEVVQNLASFKSQIGKILDFDSAENPIAFRFNSEWLAPLSCEKLIELSANFTVQQMLERDMFEKRMQENKPLFVHEFFYPLMQGYDSVVLDVDLEVGGTDQTFNMLAGRTLVKRYLGREKFVMTTTLLTNPTTGEKLMSKSLGTGIGLSEDPVAMFGKVMALDDGGIVQVFTDCTRLSQEEVAGVRARLERGENPKDIKLELAHEIVRMYHTDADADRARTDWVAKFSAREVPSDVQTISGSQGELIVEVLVRHNLVESKTHARRLVEQGAIRDATSGEKLTAYDAPLTHPVTLKVGKKAFVRVTLG